VALEVKRPGPPLRAAAAYKRSRIASTGALFRVDMWLLSRKTG
jgi:hypothetical protein